MSSESRNTNKLKSRFTKRSVLAEVESKNVSIKNSLKNKLFGAKLNSSKVNSFVSKTEIQPVSQFINPQGRRSYEVYAKTNKVKINSGDAPLTIVKKKIKNFSVILKVLYLIYKRRLFSLKRIVIRNFFWERSKSSKYIVQGFLVLLIIAFLATSINGKPFTSTFVQASDEDKTLALVDDFSIVTQAGETQIPDTRKVPTIRSYVIQQGDTVSSVAERFGINGDTIRIVNGISDDYLKIGQSIKILPVSGLLHRVESGDTVESVASKYKLSDAGFSPQIIADWNNLDDVSLIGGSEIIIPGGTIEKPKPVPVEQPVNSTASAYTLPSRSAIIDTGNFIRPTSGGNVVVSQCYRGFAHDGVDIAKVWNGPTPSIVAARAGTVSFVGWEGGWTVRIKHSGGFETIYYHMAAPSPLGVGAKVNAGDYLGTMGTTGRSTGVHLHFIIKYNGATINPFSQVNLRNPGDLVGC